MFDKEEFLDQLREIAERVQHTQQVEAAAAKEAAEAEALAFSLREGVMVAKHLPSMAKSAAQQGKTSFVILVFKPGEYNNNFFNFSSSDNYLLGAKIAFDAAIEMGFTVTNRYYGLARNEDKLLQSIYKLNSDSHMLIASF